MSLHTKYRPATFDDVLGQPTIVKSLKRVVKDARGKSFCFTGPSGTGKTTIARILAAEFAGAGHNALNLEEVDGASKSGADDIRELVQRTLYRAIGSSPVKFVIIDEAHRLSAAAWTILLKPMEEPPPHVYYALCTTDAAKIPKANLTRCLKYDLKPVKEELILELLIKVVDAEGFKIDDDVIEAIAEACHGSPREALVFLEACLACKSVSEAREIMRSAGQSKDVAALGRWLVGGKALNWREAVKYVKALEGQDAESVRIILSNYFAAVLLNCNEQVAKHVLGLAQAFGKPYYTPDRLAPLLLSIGIAIGMDGP